MRRVFIVVGHSGSRKSSTIRALTGAGPPRVFQIMQINDTILDIYVHHVSLQEKKITPDEFIARVEELDGNPDVLVALRTRPSQNPRFPNAQEYALRFEEAGWQIAGIATLHGGLLDPPINNAPQPIPILSSQTMPANQIVNIIRGVWNWL